MQQALADVEEDIAFTRFYYHYAAVCRACYISCDSFVATQKPMLFGSLKVKFD